MSLESLRARFNDLYERSDYPETRPEYAMAFARLGYVLILLALIALLTAGAAALAFVFIFVPAASPLPLWIEVGRRIVGLILFCGVGVVLVKFFEP